MSWPLLRRGAGACDRSAPSVKAQEVRWMLPTMTYGLRVHRLFWLKDGFDRPALDFTVVERWDTQHLRG